MLTIPPASPCAAGVAQRAAVALLHPQLHAARKRRPRGHRRPAGQGRAQGDGAQGGAGQDPAQEDHCQGGGEDGLRAGWLAGWLAGAWGLEALGGLAVVYVMDGRLLVLRPSVGDG